MSSTQKQELPAVLRHHADEGMFVTNTCAALLREAADELEALRRELESASTCDGIYYITQERAFAPGCSGDWPDVIAHPSNKNGRLVKRQWKRK